MMSALRGIDAIALLLAITALSIGLLLYRLTQSAIKAFHDYSSHALYDMFLFTSPARILAASAVLAAFVGALLAWLTTNLLFIIPPFLLTMVVPNWAIRHFSERRKTAFSRQLPSAIEAISHSMKAGINFTQAFETITKMENAPLSQEFSLVLQEIRLGSSWEASLQHLEKRIPIEPVRYLVSSILISREVGGNLADLLQSLATTMRRVHEVEQKILALTSQGRMQGKIMTGLPVFLGLCLTALEPVAMQQLWTTPVGWIVSAIAIALLAIGYFFIRKIVGVTV